MKKLSRWISLVLFAIAVSLSFVVPYWWVSYSGFWWAGRGFSQFFVWNALVVLPFLILWLGLLLTKGKLNEIKNHARVVIVLVALLLVGWFTLFKWTVMVNEYGVYSHYIKNTENGTGDFFESTFRHFNSSSFEGEVLYRGFMEHMYDLTFRKIWTFDAIVLLSAFLLLQVVPKRDQEL